MTFSLFLLFAAVALVSLGIGFFLGATNPAAFLARVLRMQGLVMRGHEILQVWELLQHDLPAFDRFLHSSLAEDEHFLTEQHRRFAPNVPTRNWAEMAREFNAKRKMPL